MKQFNILLAFFFLTNFTYCQNPLVKQWDKRYGGTGWEYLTDFCQTSDNGYILGGYTVSDSSGDITQPPWPGNFDYWIIKIDSIGNKLWNKRFGGTGGDMLSCIEQTSDGGYILGGTSDSPVSGDKTQNTWGGADYWIIKIDSLGNKQWDKDFGGTAYDPFSSLVQTTDNGYILAGYSTSGIGGDKTQASWDVICNPYCKPDYWIVKIDSLGNKQWDKRFGGTDFDLLSTVQQTPDGGYILGGSSWSAIGGDKTQACKDTCLSCFYRSDYWLVKTDPFGNMQWDKVLGGLGKDDFKSLTLTSDNGFILGGISFSGIGGDKTVPLWDTCLNCAKSDFWILKSDSLGNKLWDKDFGGFFLEDEFGNISQTTDGGYLLAGTSYSPVSGDKTENNLAIEQSWILKTDSLGNKQWDKTLHTNPYPDDEISFATQTRDGCYAMANYTMGGIAGDKTQANWDTLNSSADYWIIKFCDTTLTTGLNSDTQASEGVLFFPNPFMNTISVIIPSRNSQQVIFIIHDILGQAVFLEQENNLNNSFTKTLDLEFLSKGIYMLDIIIDGKRIVKKIIKD